MNATIPLAARNNPILMPDPEGEFRPARTGGEWEQRRRDTLERIQAVAGPLPDRSISPDPEIEILYDEILECGVRRQKIRYFSESKEAPKIEAWLFSPTARSPFADSAGERDTRAGVLCLHQTNRMIGKHEPAGLGGDPSLFQALELARRGFFTMAPDFTGSGAHPGLDRFPNNYAAATMKGIVDHMRAVDILSGLPAVDAERIGCIGHSLGGFNTMFLTAFDPRIHAAVSSCGFVNWQAYHDREGSVWQMAGANYLPRLRQFLDRLDDIPFDWHELLAACAPRPVFLNAPLRDDPFLAEGVSEVVAAARPVYGLFGVPDQLVIVHPDTGHEFPAAVREAAYAFLEQHLGPVPAVARAGSGDPVAHLRLPATGWKFRSDPRAVGESEGWFAPALDTSDWRSDVPIESGWQKYMDEPYLGEAWYRIPFEAPKIPAGHEAVLYFHGVDEEARVWLNGALVGAHEEGLAGFIEPFAFRVTEQLHSGKPNLLAVRIRNTVKEGGIDRPVFLRSLPPDESSRHPRTSANLP